MTPQAGAPRAVHFDIGRITLHGYSPGQRTRFVSSLRTRLAELYALLHAARFGRSLWTRMVFLYRLQIDRQWQKYIMKSKA